MFKKDNMPSKPNLFTNYHTVLDESVVKLLDDPDAWYNQFRQRVTNKINEEPFRPLYCINNGAPNASIRLQIAMMILKELQGWTDIQLFENCQLHLGARVALGLFNADDPIPGKTTYYNLRRNMVQWESTTGEYLLGGIFSSLAESQIEEFGISGNKLRIDSTLIGSNIAWYSRYELIHETLRLAFKKVHNLLYDFLSVDDFEILNHLSVENGEKVSFRSTKAEVETKLLRLGKIIYSIISRIPPAFSKEMQTLHNVFYQQYSVTDGVVIPLPKQDLKASNIQSPHDTDCDYHKKGDTEIKGYTADITETCDPNNPLNLLTSADIHPASTPDVALFQNAIEKSQEIISDKIEKVHSDGAFYSPENIEYCKDNDIEHIFSRMGGNEPKHNYDICDDGNLLVTCRQTNETTIAHRANNKEGAPPSWKFQNGNKKAIYIKLIEVEANKLRRVIAEIPKKVREIRNNVEATVYHVKHQCSSEKTRYRELIRNRFWLFSRCICVNFKRILNYLKRKNDTPSILNANMSENKSPNNRFSLFFEKYCIKYSFLLQISIIFVCML